MLFEPSLYNVAINEVAIALQHEYPLVEAGRLWETATAAVGRLVEEDLIIKPEQCQWRNPERTADCENLAPLTKSWCFDHGVY
jgi:hypothetical protein